MKVIELDKTREFTKGGMKRFFLVEDSPFFKIINFALNSKSYLICHLLKRDVLTWE